MRNLRSPWISGSTLIGFLTIATAFAAGCDGGESTSGQTTTSKGGGGSGATTITEGGGGTGGTTVGGGGTGGTTVGGGGTGGTGGTTTTSSTTEALCGKTATTDTRGSAIAISSDDSIVVAVNRDVGTASVFKVDYASGSPVITKAAEVTVGPKDSEPWQVAMDACGTRAYVVLRKDQQVVEILDLAGTPTVGKSVAVGSEPTGIALTPNNNQLYVTNWVNGTVNAISAADMTVTSTIDLNPILATSGLLGPAVEANPRASLAHPRAIAITNNGDGNDADESVIVTEWFAQRTAPENLAGVTIDTNWKGLLYKFTVNSTTPTLLDLPPVLDTGFPDHNGGATGCFPNQVASVSLRNGFAYVTSTCASPKGPIGVFAGKNAGGACTVATQAADCGMIGGVCNANTLVCNPNITDVKTTTHPAVSIINIAANSGATVNVDKPFIDLLATTRVPLLPSDIGFKNNFAYIAGQGTDALFRFNAMANTVGVVGAGAGKEFINLRKDATDKLIRSPIGVAIANQTAFGFVVNEGSRDVTAIDFNAQAIAKDGAANFIIASSSALPGLGTPEESVLKGKRFFNTGLGRWSLGGQGWGACAACHVDGLTDNVTWYFARGPRQSVSLDGSFATSDGNDQRIFNWTAIFDEVADFELNTRGVSGGVGAIVNPNSDPIMVSDRVNLTADSPPQQALQGSALHISEPTGDPLDPHIKHGVLTDWHEVTEFIKTIRSPRKPTNLVAADVAAGKTLFGAAQGNCVGCHSGPKWTISKIFWPIGDTANAATASASPDSLGNKDWSTSAVAAGFPALLFPIEAPSVLGTDSRMRFGAPPGAEQIQCILRPVGTIKTGADTTGVSAPEIGVLELRQDMVTKGQGAASNGRGFNPPSLLGMQVGAPFYHAGNARTLEEVFDTLFTTHYQSAVAAVFNPSAAQKKQLVAYVLSIDEDEPAVAVPAKGNKGGDICFYP